MSDTNETTADIIAEMKRRKEMLEDAAFNAPLCYSTETVQAQHEILDEFIERFEAAHKREREAITPKSDPDWKDICAKCKDGDIEPNYCEYYEEPNGCNSPIYGEHPTAKKSLVVGDCAKLREALKLCLRGMCGYCRMDAEARGMTTECVNGCEVMLGAKAALDTTEKEGGAK